MKSKILTLSFILFLIFSCKKESVEPTCESQATGSYLPMSVGSYWIYQWYEVDSLGVEELMEGKLDTITILKDTLIGGDIYKKIEENNSQIFSTKVTKFRRDSLWFLVDPLNNIYFSFSNFTDTLKITNNNNFKIIFKMEIPNAPIETIAGIFDCLNFQGKVTPFLPVDWSSKNVNTYYSRGVGKVQESTFYFSSANDTELQRRLVEYNLE